MSSKPQRILVSGDVCGKFDQLFSRVNSIQKKSGAFDLLLCVGDLFGGNDEEWQKYKKGSATVPIPTLVLGANQSQHEGQYSGSQGGDLCNNITYLGKKGFYTGSSGLQIAYLSGTESQILSDGTSFSPVDISTLTEPVKNDTRFKGVDILITSQWPKDVTKYGADPDGCDGDSGCSETISQLALTLKPRYHFSGLQDVHYERQPYRNHRVLNEAARQVTRFISLAKVGNKQKKKWLYAFNITPMAQMEQSDLVAQPPDVTECPYKARSFVAQDDQKEQFFYDMKAGGGGKKRQGHGGGERQQKRPKPVPTGPCWFCLGSAEVEKHLVVSVGTETYVALAKGGLVDDHVLILPIGHYQSSVSAPADVMDEIENYKACLKKCFKKQGKAVVFFERNYRTQHLQIQVVPIPRDSIHELKDTFMECAEAEALELNEIPQHSDIRQIVQVGVPYFYAELPTGEKMYCRISKKFPLQFGREVVASPAILNMPERVDWKVCSISKTQEESLADDFKSTFKPYDFNLDE